MQTGMPAPADLIGLVHVATGSCAAGASARRVGGGDISEAWRVECGGRALFVKLQPAARQAVFVAEAAGLAALGVHLRVPAVVAQGVHAGRAYLILEALDLSSGGDAAALGEALAAMHRAPQQAFGWGDDNWIGATPQPNGWFSDWLAFWRDQRLGFQLDRAARQGYGGRLQRDGERLLADLAAFFTGYTPTPSLLHGDLWGGNHAYLADGSPVLFDPAVYVGDRECDLAMTRLFGGFAPEFHAAYQASWPLDSGFAVRGTLYNLYHVLNHANLFGGGYVAQAERMAARLVAEIR